MVMCVVCVQAQSIFEHQKEINECWNSLTTKADQRKAKLLDSYDLQRFLSDSRSVSHTHVRTSHIIFSRKLQAQASFDNHRI